VEVVFIDKGTVTDHSIDVIYDAESGAATPRLPTESSDKMAGLPIVACRDRLSAVG
jgi:hypothetical protein